MLSIPKLSDDSGENTVACDGWWYQAQYGRQPMEGLVLAFSGEAIRGIGSDLIGPFTLSGNLKPDGSVRLYKSYIGMHTVEYVGAYDGEGTMKGHWRLGDAFDKWAIYIKRTVDEPIDNIKEIVP